MSYKVTLISAWIKPQEFFFETEEEAAVFGRQQKADNQYLYEVEEVEE